MKFLKYGFLFFIAIGVVIYFRVIKKPTPYDSWQIAQKYSCVYGAYYFSYLFKTDLDNSKINSECDQAVLSILETKTKGPYTGLFCGNGAGFAYDAKVPEQFNFMNKVGDLVSEDKAKIIELVRLCIRAVQLKLDPIYKEFGENFDIKSVTVEPPPRNLYLEFTNIKCGIATSPPCFD